MLSKRDVEWIKNNRDEVVQNREYEITAYINEVVESSPITGEPIRYEDVEYTLHATVRPPSMSETKLVDEGYVFEQDDLIIAFKYDEVVALGLDVYAIDYIEYNEREYNLQVIQPRGIGTTNRFECLARLIS